MILCRGAIAHNFFIARSRKMLRETFHADFFSLRARLRVVRTRFLARARLRELAQENVARSPLWWKVHSLCSGIERDYFFRYLRNRSGMKSSPKTTISEYLKSIFKSFLNAIYSKVQKKGLSMLYQIPNLW